MLGLNALARLNNTPARAGRGAAHLERGATMSRVVNRAVRALRAEPVSGVRALWLLALALFAAGCLKTPDRYAASTLDAKVNPPATFELEAEPFCFGGSNNYYPIFKPAPAVDSLFEAAEKMDFRVMRLWAMLDIGSLDGSVPHVDGAGAKQDVYLHYWDPVKKAPAYNDGPNGMVRMDYMVAKAAQHNVKLIMVLVNNWRDFGGMDQYLTWFGRDKHHEFYTAPEVKQAYKNWVQHVVMRTNSITGKPYREDPTIFSWELANEPRNKAGRAFDRSEGWTNSTITDWADEMSRYIKSLDPNHMVSVGDEGFLNGGGSHWAYKANDGVDHAALTALPGVDFGTFHLYPEDWGATLEWGEAWIADHVRVARELNKPTVLEEFGVKVGRTGSNLGPTKPEAYRERERAYRRWNEIMLRRGGNGSLAWMLANDDETGNRYPDWDKFEFYPDDRTGLLLADYAKRFKERAPACRFAPPPAPGSKPSPFVRVRKSGPVELASGWAETKG